MTFKYYDKTNDEVVEYIETLPFTDNAVIGDGFKPFALSHEFIIPSEFSLSAAYPNPFNSATTLKFGLPVDTEVSIDIYNLQGRLVETLTSRYMEAGYHRVVWNADSHSSGVYFVKMIAHSATDGGSTQYLKTQKLMLVK